jgi:hypothetical protein
MSTMFGGSARALLAINKGRSKQQTASARGR